MKLLNLLTIVALLFSSSAIAQNYNNNDTQKRDMTRQGQNAQDDTMQRGQDGRMQRTQDQQKPSYGQDEYDSRYGEGVRRDKQAREKKWEKKRERKREKYKKQYKDKNSDQGGY